MKYALEQLYVDQDPDWVIDTVPAVLAWVPGKRRSMSGPPFVFEVDQASQAAVSVELDWDLNALMVRDPTVDARASRMRSGRTAQVEDVTKLAGYGLAMVAISLLMPGRRVVSFQKWASPDLLFDVTPARLCGVEVAARSRGGHSELAAIAEGTAHSPGKRAQLRLRTDIYEAHLSLWCAAPRRGTMWQVKP